MQSIWYDFKEFWWYSYCFKGVFIAVCQKKNVYGFGKESETAKEILKTRHIKYKVFHYIIIIDKGSKINLLMEHYYFSSFLLYLNTECSEDMI